MSTLFAKLFNDLENVCTFYRGYMARHIKCLIAIFVYLFRLYSIATLCLCVCMLAAYLL